jgi:hypothetical protein
VAIFVFHFVTEKYLNDYYFHHLPLRSLSCTGRLVKMLGIYDQAGQGNNFYRKARYSGEANLSVTNV